MAAYAGDLCAEVGRLKTVGVIGGTGAIGVLAGQDIRSDGVETPYGEPSSALQHWETGATRFCFIARHGLESSIPPHSVNYRANMWALQEFGVDCVIGVNAVGGITPEARPARLMFPDQLIDYTSGREHTFADGILRPLEHIDFTQPVSDGLHAELVSRSRQLSLSVVDSAVYGVTQGPRLETAAEIDRLERDGCDIVGMTAMPEAALARELGLEYAIAALVVNWAPGKGPADQAIHADINRYIDEGMGQIVQLLATF
jgi:5'-methylthioinosine phosphorylase